jgi:hypothetical protein
LIVVYVDDELLIEVDESGTRDVGALDDEDGIVFTIDGGRDANCFRAGELAVRVRHGVAHDDFRFFIERLEQPVKTERRSQTVAVGTNVRGDSEAPLRLNQFHDLNKHGFQKSDE